MQPVADPETFVTPDLVAEVVAQVAGDLIDVGPMSAGPGGVARVHARGILRRAEVRREGAGPLAFEARIPVAIELTVEAAGGRHRYSADVEVQVHAAIDHDGTNAVVTLRPLTARDVRSRLRPPGLQATLLAKVGDVEGELRREVAAYVNRRFEGEDVRALSRIPLPG
jgi:hypothetical protein